MNIVSEYKKFIGGGGSNQNLFSFLEGKSDSKEQEEIKKELLNNFKKDEAAFQIEEIKKNIIFPMLDNTQFAYSIQDILNMKAFKSRNVDFDASIDFKNKSTNFLSIVYEDSFGRNLFGAQIETKDLPNQGSVKNKKETASIVDMITPIKSEHTVDPINAFKNNDLFKEDDPNREGKKRLIKGNFATPVYKAETIFVNGGTSGGSPPESNRYKNPGLAGIVIKNPNFGITSRNADPINIFFNAIPPIEMARCVPYINIAVVTLQDEVTPKKMNNVTFMRFLKNKGTNAYELDENIGLYKSKPYDYKNFGTIFNDNKFDDNILRDVSLMDIFTSPQTFSNANINSSNESLNNSSLSNHVLEPISPFLTLNSVSVDISGMGIALFSSKVASMELTLHDRSRLSDISSLVAPNQFGFTKIILEYGWSHPEGGIESNNDIAKFLNSARDRSIFTVKSSNFNFSDGNTVKVSLSLSCYGADESKSVSAAAGAKIPLSVFKPTIERIIDEKLENDPEFVKDSNGNNLKHREVRHILNVAQRNITATDSLISYENFTNLIDAYRKSKINNQRPDNNDFLKALESLVTSTGNNNQLFTKQAFKEDAKKEKFVPNELNKDATELLYGKLYALTEDFKDDLDFLNLDHFLLSVCDFTDYKTVSSLVKSVNEEKSGYVSLGKVFMSFIGHSLAMSGLFDEVQMIFYPLNVNAGAARGHTTASFPISKSKLKEVIGKKVSSDSSISINTIFNLIERKIIRDNSNFAYGLNSVENNYDEESKAIKELEEEYAKLDGESAAAKSKKETILERKKLAREARKEGITSKCAYYYASDLGPTTEPKFIRPNLSLYIETLPSVTVNDDGSLTEDSNNSLSDFKKFQKNICRVHIYDEESVTKPFESLLNNMLTEGSAGRAVVESISNENKNGSGDITSYLSVKKNDGDAISSFANSDSIKGKMIHYTLTVPPSKIKAAIKRGYPSITYGASSGVVKNISVSSNVSNNVSQVIMISSNARNNPQNNKKSTNNLEEMKVVPSTVSVEMLGNPFIQRGNQIYIDFGTNTTLDNIYTVKSVKHSISAGEFSTSVDLIYAGQGEISSIRDKIATAIDKIT